MKKVVTRFAPSPTGYLHIGGLRTALYNFLFAKRHGGSFLLRVEDTDRERFVEGSIESLIRTLSSVGIAYDEGPVLAGGQVEERGTRGPYIQSERLETYRKYLNDLLKRSFAYPCFCTKDRLDAVRKQQQLAKMPTKYDRTCLNLSKEESQNRIEAGEAHVYRMRVPEGETTFTDVIRGPITISHKEVDDQVLLKSDGFPTYHLAVVVDDHLMEVTHVIRGEEWLSSTPKHVLLYDMFGWEAPAFAHLPLILNPDRSKLSKRQGDVAVEDFLAQGYLPEALVNFVALLGWNPKGDQELYTVEELVSSFALESVNKGGAVLDRTKLDWMNGEYIKKLPTEDLLSRVRQVLEGQGMALDQGLLEKICVVERERLNRLDEIVERLPMYQEHRLGDPSLLVWKKADAADAKNQLENVLRHIEDLPTEVFAERGDIERSLKSYIVENELQNGNVLWPLRVALSGEKNSPSPFELLWVLGKEESLRRLHDAIAKLG